MIYQITKWFISLSILVSFTYPQKQNTLHQFEHHRNRDFNDGWKFFSDSVTGAEQPEFNDSAWKNGFNAIRTSHNPPSKLFLEYCDKLEMLVLEETFDMWEHPKKPQDYHLYFRENWKSDIESMVYRDRNHPSVIMWSIGNEIYQCLGISGRASELDLARE